MKPAPPVTRSRPNALASRTSGDRPSDGWRQQACGIVLSGHLGRAEERRNRPGVGPMTAVGRAEKVARRYVVVEDVGDLQLATSRWQEVVDDGEGIRSQEIDADRDEVALGPLGLLLEADHPAVRVKLRDAETFRVGDLVEERAGAIRAVLELGGDVGKRRA